MFLCRNTEYKVCYTVAVNKNRRSTFLLEIYINIVLKNKVPTEL